MTPGTGHAVVRTVMGRYRLVEQLGAGAYGTVWRAHDEILDVTVALKEVRLPPLMSDRDTALLLTRVEREARMVAKLRDHPHVVTILDVIQEHGLPWIIMEFVPSRSLAEIVRSRGSLPPGEIARIGVAILAAIMAAHEIGITHRDVKPANILLGDDGRVVLVDFGLATHVTDPTITDGPIGTLAYMAPEQFDGVRSLPASDLFSLGATLHFAAAGISPFSRGTEAATVQAVLTDNPRVALVPQSLADTIHGLLTKDPDHRLSADLAMATFRSVASRPMPSLSAPEPPALGSRPSAQPETEPASSPTSRWVTGPPPTPAAHTGLARPAELPTSGLDEAHPPEPALPAIRYGEAYADRIAGVILAITASGLTAGPWIARAVLEPPAWVYPIGALWSIFFGVFTGAFCYLLARPDRLVVDESSLHYRQGIENHVVRWDALRSIRLHERRIEMEFLQPTDVERYASRTRPPMVTSAGSLVFCSLDNFAASSVSETEAALLWYGGTTFTDG